jgi:uncharacterized protein YgbK (DUF1537 family)
MMMHAGLRVVIVADDLTGAMDAAAPFARRGLDVRVLTSSEDLKLILSNPPQILSVNTGTRHMTEDVSKTLVNTLIGDLLPLKPKLLIKKIDSTLRGHVVAETIAAMQAAKRHEVLFCPAVPAQGRTLSGGELFINGVPLSETGIAQDLRSPPPVTPLPDLFRGALADTAVILEKTGSTGMTITRQPVPCIRIVDAETAEDLQNLADAVIDRCEDILFVGAAGLTEALADALFGPELSGASPPALSGASLYVIGSRALQSSEQVEALCVTNPWTRVAELTDVQPLDAKEMQRLSSPVEKPAILVVRAPRAKPGSSLDPELVVNALAASTVDLLEKVKVSLLLMTGGDTVLAVLEALGVKTIQVLGEVKPGIVYGIIDTSLGPLCIVTKAGAFGDGQLFCTIEEHLRRGSASDFPN